jgi:hypothetical protein
MLLLLLLGPLPAVLPAGAPPGLSACSQLGNQYACLRLPAPACACLRLPAPDYCLLVPACLPACRQLEHYRPGFLPEVDRLPHGRRQADGQGGLSLQLMVVLYCGSA